MSVHGYRKQNKIRGHNQPGTVLHFTEDVLSFALVFVPGNMYFAKAWPYRQCTVWYGVSVAEAFKDTSFLVLFAETQNIGEPRSKEFYWRLSLHPPFSPKILMFPVLGLLWHGFHFLFTDGNLMRHRGRIVFHISASCLYYVLGIASATLDDPFRSRM